MTKRQHYTPRPHDIVAYDWALHRRRAGLFLDMGLGKTATVARLIKYLLACFDIRKPIVIAPKLVTEQTWLAELEKWDVLEGLTVSRIIGTEKQRIAALNAPADFYAVSRDNVAWLIDYLGKDWDFDFVILDESSNFRNRQAQRYKAVRKIRSKTSRFLLLTGTPMPKSYMDLWAQVYLLDGGERLYKNIGQFRARYFDMRSKGPHLPPEYVLKPGAKEAIQELIGDICLSMKSEDWVDLPDLIDVIEFTDLPKPAEYREFVKRKVLELDEGTITPANAGALYGKLLQYSNGAVYDSDKVWHEVHTAKIDLLAEKLEALNGQPALVFYQFQSDIERIQKRVGKTRILKTGKDVEDWNAGKIDILLAHEITASYGLNMQEGGNHLFWFGVSDDVETYLQALKRLHRPGQPNAVINTKLVCRGTVEETVIIRGSEKIQDQSELMSALNHHLRELKINTV